MISSVNYLAIVTAACANFGLGWVWYQLLFKQVYPRELGLTPAQVKEQFRRNMSASLAISFFRGHYGLVFRGTMARIGIHSWSAAMELALLLWFGLMATAQLSEKIFFAGRTWTAYLINTGYPLATLVLGGTIFSVWP